MRYKQNILYSYRTNTVVLLSVKKTFDTYNSSGEIEMRYAFAFYINRFFILVFLLMAHVFSIRVSIQ